MADQITPRPKTQREIFLDTPGQQPYVYPDGTVNENPNLNGQELMVELIEVTIFHLEMIIQNHFH